MTMRARLAVGMFSGIFVVACGGSTSSDAKSGGSGGTNAGGTNEGGTNAGGTNAGGSGGVVPTGGSAGVGASGGAGGSQGLEISVVDRKEQPISGAIVVVDEPDGTEHETETDALGVATFPSVDLGAASVDVTAFSPGNLLVSVLGIGATSSKVIHMRPPYATPKQTITVNFSGKLASDDCVALSATDWGLYQHLCGDSGELELQAAATGKILALEHGPATSKNFAEPPIKAAVVVDIPSAGSSVDVDFSKSLPIESISGSFQVPAPSNGFVFSQEGQDVFEVSGPSWTRLSLFSSSPGTGLAVDWKADFVRPFPDSEVSTRFGLGANNVSKGAGTFGWVSVSVPGYPTSGVEPTVSFPVPAAFTLSSTPKVFAPIAWVASADRPNRLVISAVSNNVAGESWDIWFPSERDSVTPHKPPSSIWNALEWKDADHALLYLSFCEPVPGACGGGPCPPTVEPNCARDATSFATSNFDLTPP